MTIYGKGCISNYRNCSLSYVWYSVLYRMLTEKANGLYKKSHCSLCGGAMAEHVFLNYFYNADLPSKDSL